MGVQYLKPITLSYLVLLLSRFYIFSIFVIYTGDPIHRGPLFRDIQYIANRPWTPNLP